MYKLVLRLDVGSQAEDFTLKDHEGRPVRLNDMIGKGIILLTFYTGGFDRESMRYLKMLGDNYGKMKEMGVEVVAITPELTQKVDGTVRSLQLPFNVLSDPELKVAKQYDVYDPMAEWCYPAAFVIDKNGIIQYVYRGVSSPNTPPVPYLLKKFEQMAKKEQETGADTATAR
jgi:thioredoxin-dependent peroxiredoxin